MALTFRHGANRAPHTCVQERAKRAFFQTVPQAHSFKGAKRALPLSLSGPRRLLHFDT